MRNPIAKNLRSPKYRKQIVKQKNNYVRSDNRQAIADEMDCPECEDMSGMEQCKEWSR